MRFTVFLLGIALGVAPGIAKGETAIEALARRVLKERARDFRFETLTAGDKDSFEIEAVGDKIVIRGNTPVSQASGLFEYLKDFGLCDVSWTGSQVALPKVLPKPASLVRRATLFDQRYYLNFCTFNYTMSFWDWRRWEKELDWMALNGVNLELAGQIGQEAVWQRTMTRLGQTDEEIRQFLPGPCFGAWWMMGNLQGWGGPTPAWWISRQVELEKKILKRMRELGIEPVMAAFYGNVPSTLKGHYPESQFVSTGKWFGYERPDMILPNDPLFAKVAATFYEEQRNLFGDAKYFAGDPFHEGGVAKVDLKATGGAIERAMQEARAGATWVLQAWGNNPHDEMLAGTTPNRTLILDLRGEAGGQYEKRNAFGGRPWLLCTISGYGGKNHFSGWMPENAQGSFRALSAPGMRGIGAMMEGTEVNTAVFQMLFDLVWRDRAPDIEDWCANYARRRYGRECPEAEEAWRIFARTVYSLPKATGAQGQPESVLCARPALDIRSTSTWGTTRRSYDVAEFLTGWAKLVDAARTLGGSQAFRYDLVDVTRQALSDIAQVQHWRMAAAFRKRDTAGFERESTKFLQILDDMDKLLSTRTEFMLGTWLSSARALGKTKEDRDWLEWNARTQITVWARGGDSADLRDYANKEWSGLLRNFYRPRWARWIEDRKKELGGETPAEIDWFAWEIPWTKGHELYPTTPQGDSVAEARRIFRIYGKSKVS